MLKFHFALIFYIFFRDEPTVGIDPVNGNIIWNYLKNLSMTNSTTILVTTHSINEAERSDKVGFMRRGKVLVESSPQALLAKYSVKTLDEVFYAVSLEDEKSNAVSHTVCRDNLFFKKKTSIKMVLCTYILKIS